MRFLIPPGETLNVDEHGFLPDPDALFGRARNLKATTLDALDDNGCVCVVGELGAGKTHLLNLEAARWQSLGDDDTFVVRQDLGSHSTQLVLSKLIEESGLEQAMSDKKRCIVILDGLDEGHQYRPDLPEVLAHRLEQLPAGDVRLRIATRSGPALLLLGKHLPVRWPLSEWLLAPLRRRDVFSVAASIGVKDSEAFVEEASRRGLTSWLTRPFTLRMVAQSYTATGELPHDQRQMFEEGCLGLCREHDDTRLRSDAGSLDPAQRMEVAARLAALMTLRQCSTVDVGAARHLLDASLPAAEASGGTEMVAGSAFPVTEYAIRETVSYGLFAPASNSSFRFVHDGLREFLAARWLGRLAYRAARALILHDSDFLRRPRPSLAGTSIWVAADAPALRDHVLETDPMLLVTSECTIPAAAVASDLVEKLLEPRHARVLLAARIKPDSFARLTHPSLAEQLRPYLTIPTTTDAVVLWLALSIIWGTKLRGLEEEVRVIVETEAIDGWLRRDAVHALAAVGSDSLTSLAPMLANPALDEQLKAAVLIELLTADLIPLRDVFPILTMPRNDMFDMYDLWPPVGIPAKLTVDDLPTAVGWVTSHVVEGETRFLQWGRLYETIWRRAWNEAGRAPVAAALESALDRWLESDDYQPWEPWMLAPIDGGDAIVRRTIQRRLDGAEDPELTARSIAFAMANALSGGDPAWYEAQASAAISDSARAAWQLLCQIVRRPAADRSGWTLTRPFEMLRLPEEPPWPPDGLGVELARVEAGELERIVDVADLLHARAGEVPGRQAAEWDEVGAELLERIIAAARHVVERSSEASTDALVEAVGLLSEQRIGDVRLLPHSAWPSLIRAIVRQPDAVLGALVRTRLLLHVAVSMDPVTVVDEAIGRVRHDIAAGHGFAARKFTLIWSYQNLARTAIEMLREPHVMPEAIEAVLASMLIADVPEAREEAAVLIAAATNPSDASLPRAAASARALLVGAPDGGWDVVFPMIEAFGEDVGKQILGAAPPSTEGGQGSLASRLAPRQRADLIVWLDQHPDAGEQRSGFKGPREYRADLRRACLESLVSGGSREALDALLHVASETGRELELAALLDEATRAVLAASGEKPTCEDVLEISRDAQRRIARTSAEVLDGIEDVLHEYDERLRGPLQRGAEWWIYKHGQAREHRDEDSLTSLVRAEIVERLQRRGPVVAAREVQPTPREQLDLLIVGLVDDDRPTPAEVICEAKGSWNPEWSTALVEQLVDRYMRPRKMAHGLYIVYWIDGAPGATAARRTLEDQARSVRADGFDVRVVVLDGTPKDEWRPRRVGAEPQTDRADQGNGTAP